MFLMLELTFKDSNIMLFCDMWEVIVLIDFKADPTSCSVVGGILLTLQLGAEVWGSISKAEQGKALSLEQKTKKVILCSKMSCTGLSWGMVSPVNCIGKLSTSSVLLLCFWSM